MTAPTEVAPIPSLDVWWSRHRDLARCFARPIEQALAAGFAADRLGYAFASGYQTALAQLLGERLALPTAFCVTEERDIATRLVEAEGSYHLSGAKSFVTLGGFAERLLVVASSGHDDRGRNRLRVVALDHPEGLTLEPVADLPFVPEIGHATVRFDALPVAPSQLLPGDGYADYVKPFRTIEDLHIHAAILGWLLRLSRKAWPEPITERLLAAALSIDALATHDPTSPAAHVALAGALQHSAHLIDELDPLWASLDDETQSRWRRDRDLLRVASGARAKRRDSAWRALSDT
ncbi:MAG: hypothetical protein R3B72_08795 [Polyangiaceae bacterium]